MISAVQNIVNMTTAMWHDWPVGRINCILVLVMPFLITIIAWISFHNSRFFSKKEKILCKVVSKKVIPAYEKIYPYGTNDYEPGKNPSIYHPAEWLVCVEPDNSIHQQCNISVTRALFQAASEGCHISAICTYSRLSKRILQIENPSIV